MMHCIVKDVGKREPCGLDSGDNLVCNFHRKFMNKNQKARADEAWHDYIVERGNTRDVGYKKEYQCHHCGAWFTRRFVCGDHFPHTKGSRPDLRYNAKDDVTSCKTCNDPASQHRLESLRSRES